MVSHLFGERRGQEYVQAWFHHCEEVSQGSPHRVLAQEEDCLAGSSILGRLQQ